MQKMFQTEDDSISADGGTRRDRKQFRYMIGTWSQPRYVINLARQKSVSYFGHVVHMIPNQTQNILLYEQVEGKRPVGRPEKRLLDVVGEDCKILGVHLACSRSISSPRPPPTQGTDPLPPKLKTKKQITTKWTIINVTDCQNSRKSKIYSFKLLKTKVGTKTSASLYVPNCRLLKN